jgi:hypothetical protein
MFAIGPEAVIKEQVPAIDANLDAIATESHDTVTRYR